LYLYSDTSTTEIYSLSLHDALPICCLHAGPPPAGRAAAGVPTRRCEVLGCVGALRALRAPTGVRTARYRCPPGPDVCSLAGHSPCGDEGGGECAAQDVCRGEEAVVSRGGLESPRIEGEVAGVRGGARERVVRSRRRPCRRRRSSRCASPCCTHLPGKSRIRVRHRSLPARAPPSSTGTAISTRTFSRRPTGCSRWRRRRSARGTR